MNDKIKSRKFIFSAWAAITFTALGVFALIKDTTAAWVTTSMPLLIAIVGAYVGIGRLKEKTKK